MDDTEDEELTPLFRKTRSMPSQPSTNVKREPQGTWVWPINVESIEEKVAEIQKLLPDLRYDTCEDMLRACSGNVRQALNIMLDDTPTQAHLIPQRAETSQPKPLTSATAPAGNNTKKERFPPGNWPKDNNAADQEESIIGETNRLHELCPKRSLLACEKVLRACNGDVEEAFNSLEIDSLVNKSPGTVSVGSRNGNEDFTPSQPHSAQNIPLALGTDVEQPSPSQRSTQEDNIAQFFADRLGPATKEEKADPPVVKAEDDDQSISLPIHHAQIGFDLEEDEDIIDEETADPKVEMLYETLLRKAMQKKLSGNAGPSIIKCHVPNVEPEPFDLVAQLMIRGDITIKPGPNEEKITSILELIQAANTLETPGIGGVISKMVKKLKPILVRDRLALASSHIRTADKLGEDVEPIQELFALATVRRLMQHEDDGDIDFRDDEDDDMTAAQKASYSGYGFALHREMKQLPAFSNKVKDYVLKCLCQRDRAVKRQQRGAHARISVPVFTDPLDGSTFEL